MKLRKIVNNISRLENKIIFNTRPPKDVEGDNEAIWIDTKAQKTYYKLNGRWADLTSIAEKVTGSNFRIAEVDGDLWLTANAYWDGKNWKRINTEKFAFALQIQGKNNIPFEGIPGVNIWRAVPGSNPIGDFGTYGGWEAVFIGTAYGSGVFGGSCIEIDGNGVIYGYARVVATNDGTWLTHNAFWTGSGWQADTTSASAVAIKLEKGGEIKYYKCDSPTPEITWTEIPSGGGSGDMLKSVYDTNNNGVVDNAEKLGGKTENQLNVDKVDGYHASDFASASHNHNRSAITDFWSSPFWNNIPDKPSSFTPSAHKSTHASGGTDALTPSDIGAANSSHSHTENDLTLSDVTTNNASTSKHGFCPKLSGNTSHFLRGDGSWATPPSGGGGGGWTLLYSQETDGPEIVNSTAEQLLHSVSLSDLSYSYLLIEMSVRSRLEQDASTKCDFTYRLKNGSTTIKTYSNRIIASSTSGIDSGGRINEFFSYLLSSPGSSITINFTGQMSIANTLTGMMLVMFRIWGIP